MVYSQKQIAIGAATILLTTLVLGVMAIIPAGTAYAQEQGACTAFNEWPHCYQAGSCTAGGTCQVVCRGMGIGFLYSYTYGGSSSGLEAC